jgi:hypothetical protein
VAVTELDGRPVAVSASSDGTVRLWDLRTWRQDGEPLVRDRYEQSSVTVTELDGRPVAVVGSREEHTIRVWDLRERREVRPPIRTPEPVGPIAVTSLNGVPVVLTGSGGDEDNGAVRGWDLRTGAQLGPPLTGHTWCISGIAVIERDGRPIAVTSAGTDNDSPERTDSTVRVWDLLDWRPSGHPLTGHISDVMGVATAGLDGRPVAVTCGMDGTVRLWDLAESAHQPIGDPLAGHRAEVTELAVMERAGYRLAITASLDKTAQAWDLNANGPLLASLPVERTTALALADLHGEPVAVICGVGMTRMWAPLAGWSVPLAIPFAAPDTFVVAAAVAYRGGQPIVVLASSNEYLYTWDLAAERPCDRPIHLGVGIGKLAVLVHRRRLLATVTRRETFNDAARICLVDLAGRQVVDEMICELDPAVFSTAIAAGELEGRPVVVAGSKGELRVWDVADRRVVRTLAMHTRYVHSIVTGIADGRPVVIAAGHDQLLRTWDLGTGQMIDELPLPGHCWQLALGEEGTLVAAVGDDVMAFDTGIRATVARLD